MQNKTGKLIVIEGLDGSGKSTQAKLVYDILKLKNENVKLISYPDYSQPSSTLVKMYLEGEFSSDLNDVNAYAASSFYAVDRYASFKKFWQKHYEHGGTIIATRYVSSNAVHQMVKLPLEQWDSYLNWLDDFEFNKLSLPKPDCVIFLDMPRSVANGLILARYDGDASRRDIHESNIEYMELCQKSAVYCAKKQNWSVVSCSENDLPFSIEKITQEILEVIQKIQKEEIC